MTSRAEPPSRSPLSDEGKWWIGSGPDPLIRPRKGDLEAATQPHGFRPSGEYVGPARVEVCDLCGLAQRGPGTMHPHVRWVAYGSHYDDQCPHYRGLLEFSDEQDESGFPRWERHDDCDLIYTPGSDRQTER